MNHNRTFCIASGFDDENELRRAFRGIPTWELRSLRGRALDRIDFANATRFHLELKRRTAWGLGKARFDAGGSW